MSSSLKAPIPISIKLLLCATFLMNMGGFMVVPFLAVYLSQTLHMPAWEVGTLLTTNLICSRGLPLITGMMGDRVSHSVTMISGVLIRGIGYLGYAFSHDFVTFMISSALAGIGGALYSPSVSAVFAKQPEASRKRVFTYYNQALNAGTILGPLAGGALVVYNYALPFLSGGVLFLLLTLLLFFFRKQYQTERSQSKVLETLGAVVGDKKYMMFIGSMVLFWIVFTQLNVSLPIQVFKIMHSESYISTVYLCNGITGIVIMFVLRNAFEKKAPLQLLNRGVLLMGIGLLLIPFFPTLEWLLLCVLVYTIGETYALPASDLVVSECSSDTEYTGTYFGMLDISSAIGGTIGNYLGIWLMGLSNVNWAWYSYALICLLMLATLVRVKRVSRNESATVSHS
ncbi:MAG: MDR family MFS transporter [Tumebacillaceae bacterium]